MTRTEWDALVEAFSGSPVTSDVDGLLRALLDQGLAGSGAATQELVRRLAFPASTHADVSGTPGIESLVSFPGPGVVAPIDVAASSARPQEESSVASTVMHTLAMITGVGPAVTGLLKLFGGSGSTGEPAYAPITYSLPEQVALEAGLAQDRSFVGVGYGAQGGVRALAGTQRSGGAAQIQINVNAMDSRSFADHSDDIARAVREAMLRSHTLNDVIAEM